MKEKWIKLFNLLSLVVVEKDDNFLILSSDGRIKLSFNYNDKKVDVPYFQNGFISFEAVDNSDIFNVTLGEIKLSIDLLKNEISWINNDTKYDIRVYSNYLTITLGNDNNLEEIRLSVLGNSIEFYNTIINGNNKNEINVSSNNIRDILYKIYSCNSIIDVLGFIKFVFLPFGSFFRGFFNKIDSILLKRCLFDYILNDYENSFNISKVVCNNLSSNGYLKLAREYIKNLDDGVSNEEIAILYANANCFNDALRVLERNSNDFNMMYLKCYYNYLVLGHGKDAVKDVDTFLEKFSSSDPSQEFYIQNVMDYKEGAFTDTKSVDSTLPSSLDSGMIVNFHSKCNGFSVSYKYGVVWKVLNENGEDMLYFWTFDENDSSSPLFECNPLVLKVPFIAVNKVFETIVLSKLQDKMARKLGSLTKGDIILSSFADIYFTWLVINDNECVLLHDDNGIYELGNKIPIKLSDAHPFSKISVSEDIKNKLLNDYFEDDSQKQYIKGEKG